jgi:hypothetical protein
MSTPLTPDEERALREAWARIGAWELTASTHGDDYLVDSASYEALSSDLTVEIYGDEVGAAELAATSAGRLLATLDQVRAERDAAKKALLDVHDALHRECDGTADLPAEIRALRSERDAEADERDGLSAENLALRSRVVELETALRRLVAGCEAWGREEDGVPEWEPVGPSYDAARAALKGGTP